MKRPLDFKIEKIVSFWNTRQQGASNFLSTDPSNFNLSKAEYVRSLCIDLTDTNVLEVGCGNGSDAINLFRYCHPKLIVAIDIIWQWLKNANSNIRRAQLKKRIKLLHMDAHQLAFSDNSFDAIYCNSVLLWLNRPQAFKEFIRVLKPNGFMLCLNESLDDNPILRIYRKISSIFFSTKQISERLVKRMTLYEIDQIGRCYFHQVEHREFHIFFSILTRALYLVCRRFSKGRILYGIGGIGKLGNRLDDMLIKYVPKLRRWAWISVIRFDKPKKGKIKE